MDTFSTPSKSDALQPNEQEVDVQALWAKIRGWVIGAVVLLLLAGCGLWFYLYLERRQEKIELAAQSLLTTATDQQTLESIIQQYPQTDSAGQALILLGHGKCQQQDWDGARGYYQRLYERNNSKRSDLTASALFGIGVTYEAEKNWDKALEAYAQLTSSFPQSFKAVEAKLGAARVSELKGNNEKARQFYEDILVSDTQSVWKDEAERRLKMLKVQPKKSPAR